MLPIRSFILICSVVTAVGCNTGDPPASNAPNPQSGSMASNADNGRIAVEQTSKPDRSTRSPPMRHPEKVLDDAHLHHVFRIHEKVLSGAQPEGDEGFRLLETLGVKTVISVDGAKPDVELAKKHSLRYVHLPHGYDGIPEERAKELAKAVRDLEGPIYIHCHHGKHRSPAAAAVACVAAGLIARESALGILQAAGTSKEYRGLYDSAERARRFDQKLLDELQVDFKETEEIPPLADAMVAVEHTHDHLKSFAANRWQPLAEHPDLDAGHEALLLREHYTELLRTDEVNAHPPEFRRWMQEAERNSQKLQDEYKEWTVARSAHALAALNSSFEAVGKTCAACHKQFRDVPLSEKAANSLSTASGRVH